ncbi:MAG: hypothetical protein ACE5EM_13235 [Sphingomonadales bacterium]
MAGRSIGDCNFKGRTDWREVWALGQERALTEARAVDPKLLRDIRRELDRLLATGASFEKARAALDRCVADHAKGPQA